jgi:RHS repeat-associated protein
VNGAASYTYDPVGNRTQKVSTIPGFPGGLTNYNANDQLATDTYDANGNTTASLGNGYAYDFENHLIQQGGISIAYDGDGNRVSKTVAGVTTLYFIETQNPTGYAQVITETASNGGTTAYVYGLERISRETLGGSSAGASYYVYDGHGSVRALTDPTGAVTDTYDYDAFGVLIHSTGTTPNTTLYSGEQFDPDLNLYYNRARYLNVSTGRFWTMDSYEGRTADPVSLHKYLYAGDSPSDGIDPSGLEEISLGATTFAIGISVTLGAIGSLSFAYYQDQYEVGLKGVRAQESAKSLVAAALSNLQNNANIQLFQTYFGPPIAPQIALVTSNYLKIANALNQQIDFSRDYTGYVFSSGEFAYSYRLGPLKIVLGPQFFRASLIGRDSQAGTIVHELSHIVVGTYDYGYGMAVYSLSTDQAVNNGDTYEYYAEDSYAQQNH